MVTDGISNKGRSVASIVLHMVFASFMLWLVLFGLNVALIEPGDLLKCSHILI